MIIDNNDDDNDDEWGDEESRNLAAVRDRSESENIQFSFDWLIDDSLVGMHASSNQTAQLYRFKDTEYTYVPVFSLCMYCTCTRLEGAILYVEYVHT